ncbi:putative tyrosine phosphatase [Leptomonas pyrrhocoris]|uniref:phosphatidylinositol-3,4,5-trisphosphate 3-phosphatase n=1 Tax=Leptomonas pyrrhocoris TaxID=157538 RepID=A0A0M9FPR6_LEPPY|nr:putative tyrosine phosphatase [Leptomonas pyrrhocoris]KPA73570.1 putative tyrosine phosphatase [Leptomonas pyrrhocoris]|eukprot:XP_015652009.1 putative tyrosine phosphatase [Leptomonas pyrrhocoris]
MKKARYLVSQKKLRTVDKDVPRGGIDLDLTEIHPGIVCMGYPANGVEALYRNKYEDVLRYLDYKYKTEYMVYNLCRECAYQYGSDKFHGRVRCFPFFDHAAAPLQLMPAFVKDVKEYLAEHPHGAAVIHCKAGKGRTGVMACCLLLALDPAFLQSADTVMRYYGEKRTKDGNGLTVPSQRRSVEYYARLLADYNGEVPATLPTIAITRIRFVAMPKKWSLHTLTLLVNNKEVPHYAANVRESSKGLHVDRTYTITENGVECGVLTLMCEGERRLRQLSGDLRFEFYGSNNSLIGVLSINTLFMEKTYSGREVDKLSKKCSDKCCIEFDFTFSQE